MINYDHLDAPAQRCMELSDNDRIAKIKKGTWLGYTKATQIIEKLSELLKSPKKHRMPNLLIHGETNNGKTSIVDRFCEINPAIDNEDGNTITIPALYVPTPPTPDESRFYNAIFEALGAVYPSNEKAENKQIRALKLLKNLNVKMLILDEIQHIVAGPISKQRIYLNVIKHFGNELRIPIIAVGIRDAFNAIYSDSQLANRFESVKIPRWVYNNEYLRLLDSFEKVIPIKNRSDLIDDKISEKILVMSEGTIGEINEILIEAAVLAIKTKVEKINVKILNSIDWVLPSERKRM